MIIIPFKEYHAARISDPAQYDKIVTKDLGDGIQLLLGVKKEGDTEKTETQSYHFDKEKWKPKDVKKWLKEHNEKPIELAMAKKEDKSMKENATIVSHKGDIVQEQVPIDRVPEKLFGNVRQQDVPELLESTIDATVSIGEVQKESDLEDLGKIEEPSIEPEEAMESEGEEEPEESPMEEMDGEEGNEPEEKPWDPIQAKSDMINWATDNEGKVSKKALMKWYLDIDAGDGQDSNSYRYQVGAVVNGKPYYCGKALDFSWDLASGNQTGVANRNIQKKIIFIKNREGMPLTEDQMDYSERHMSAEKVTYHTLQDDNSPGGLEFVEQAELKLNSSPAGSKIIYEDDSVIDVPVVPMREGVFTGTDGIPTLKKFEYFGKDAHWLEGQPILKGHTAPTELVTYKHNRIGKLMNVTARPDKKDVVAVARYYKDKLTPEDVSRIKSGIPYDGSIAYTTHTSMTPGELNGTKYNAVEDGGYHFYHFAELANGIGACSTKDGCGFMLNEKGYEPKVFYNDKRRAEIVKKDDGFSVTLNSTRIDSNPTVTNIYNHIDNEDIAINWSKSYVKSGSIPISKKLNYNYTDSLTKQNSQFSKLTGNNMTKEYIKANEDGVEPSKEEEMQAMLDEKDAKIAELEAKIAELEAAKDEAKMNEKAKITILEEQLNDLIQKQNAAEQALIDKKAAEDFEAFTQKLNKAHQKDAQVHYDGFKSEGWAYFESHPEIFQSEIPKMNAKGSPADEGDNTSALQQARDMLKKAQKERFSKRA